MLIREYFDNLSQDNKILCFKIIHTLKDYQLSQHNLNIDKYIAEYVKLYPESDRQYAEKRAKVAFDWVRCMLWQYAFATDAAYNNSFLSLLIFRLVYDLNNKGVREHDFLSKYLENIACFFREMSSETKTIVGFSLSLFTVLGTGAAILTSLLWAFGVINPVITPILLLPIAFGIGVLIFNQALSYIRNNHDVEKNFWTSTPNGMHADVLPRFANSQSGWAKNDRNMRPFDNLVLFCHKNFKIDNIIDAVDELEHLPGLVG